MVAHILRSVSNSGRWLWRVGMETCCFAHGRYAHFAAVRCVVVNVCCGAGGGRESCAVSFVFCGREILSI